MLQKISYINLRNQNLRVEKKFFLNIKKILESGNYTNSYFVKKFENIYSKYTGFKYCSAVSSGTAASDLIFSLLNLNKNDEIIIPAHTFLSNLATILRYNVKIIIIDIDDKTLNISLDLIKKKITKRTKAVLICDMHGRLANINKIYNFCKSKNIYLIQDSSQSHSSLNKFKNKNLKKNFFKFQSFYPTKNLGSISDGGCILTNDKKIKNKIDLMRTWSMKKNKMVTYGFNYRMNEMCAAFLLNKLNFLKSDNLKRIKLSKIYLKNFSKLQNKNLIKLQCEKKNVYYNFIIRVHEKIRNQLINHLKKKGIEIMFHYKILPHKQLPLAKKLYNKNIKVNNAEILYNQMMTIPCNTSMKEKDVLYISKIIEKFLMNNASYKI